MQFQSKSAEFYKNLEAYFKIDMEMEGVKNIKDNLQEQS